MNATRPTFALLLLGLTALTAPTRAQNAYHMTLHNTGTAKVNAYGTATTGSVAVTRDYNDGTNPGKVTAYETVEAYDSSQFTLQNGGEVYSFFVSGSGALLVSGGRIGYGVLPVDTNGKPLPAPPRGVFAQNSGTVTVTGGDLTLLSLANTSTASISGGHITDFEIAGSSVANIKGGFFEHGLFAEDTTTLNISGGSFRFLGSGAGTGTINITGTGLKVTTLGTDRYVTGTLESGEALNAFFGGGILKFNGTVQSLPAPPDEASRAAPGTAGTRVASRR